MKNCEVFDRVERCEENVRRNVRYLIELKAVRSLYGEWLRLADRVGRCKENVGKNARYLI